MLLLRLALGAAQNFLCGILIVTRYTAILTIYLSFPSAGENMAYRSHANKVCPVTQSRQNWSESEDGNLIIVRDSHVHTSQEWVLCKETSSDGAPIYRRAKDREDRDAGSSTRFVRPEPVGPTLASLDVRDAVYRKLLDLCPLTEDHRQHLHNRRIPSLHETLPMGSLPAAEKGGRWLIVKALREAFGENTLLTIPGFFRDDQGRVLLGGAEGILIPSLAPCKKIQAFQVRRDKLEEDRPRYTWLSSGWVDEATNTRNGVGSGSPTGVLLPAEWDEHVFLTEGAFKGAMLRSHVPQHTAVLYAAGVSQIAAIEAAIASLPKKPKSVTLCFDADAWRKPQVFGALVRQIRSLQTLPCEVRVMTWDEELGKGIDDFLQISPPLLVNEISHAQYLDTDGLCRAFQAGIDGNPLHLFGSSKDAALALSLGLPAVYLPRFQVEEKDLESLKDRILKGKEGSCFIASSPKLYREALELARKLHRRDLDVRIAQFEDVGSYSLDFENEADSLAIAEARESRKVRNNKGLSQVIERVRTACAGRDMALVARAIEVIKDNCSIVRGEVLKAVKSELKPSMLAENEAAQLFLEKEAHDIYFDPTAKEWMVYENEAWRTAREEEISQRVARFVATIRPKHGAGFVQGVQRMVSWTRLRSDWNTNRSLIPLTNGVLDVSLYPDGVQDPAALKLKPHESEDGLTWKLPFEFNPNAECPTIRTWFKRASSIMQADGTWRESEEYQRKLIAFIAATLRGMGSSLQMFFSLVGVPGTGKGTFFRLVEAFMGEQNIFVTNLESFEGNRFESAGVIGKRMMMVTDSDNYRGTVEKLRALAGGDRIGTEKKGVQPDPKGHRPNLTVLIASNEPIQFQSSDAMERRRITVHFDRKVEAHEQDPHLDAKLQAELPGLLNWALSLSEQEIRDALKIDGEDSREARRQILEERPIGMFVRQYLVADPSARIKIGSANRTTPKEYEESGLLYKDADSHLYPAYRQFYESVYGSRVDISSIRFNRDLASFLHAALSLPPNVFYKDTKPSRDGYSWNGIALREGQSDTRPSPFDVSPNIGNVDLQKIGQTSEVPKGIAEPVKSEDILAEQVAPRNFVPTHEETILLESKSHRRAICSEVWKTKSIDIAIQRLRPYFPFLRQEFVAWLWEQDGDAHVTLFPMQETMRAKDGVYDEDF